LAAVEQYRHIQIQILMREVQAVAILYLALLHLMVVEVVLVAIHLAVGMVGQVAVDGTEIQ
jgi:hypothetical protein